LEWFKRVINQSNWVSLNFLPWELLCSRDITKHQFTEIYDEYYDNFNVDANEESLKRSFGMIVKPIIFEVLESKFITKYMCIIISH